MTNPWIQTDGYIETELSTFRVRFSKFSHAILQLCAHSLLQTMLYAPTRDSYNRSITAAIMPTYVFAEFGLDFLVSQ